MNYVWSKFTMLNKLENSILITNLKYFIIYEIKNNGRIHNSYLTKRLDMLTDGDMDFLIQNGFLISEDTDEIYECDFIRNRSAFADSVLNITM